MIKCKVCSGEFERSEGFLRKPYEKICDSCLFLKDKYQDPVRGKDIIKERDHDRLWKMVLDGYGHFCRCCNLIGDAFLTLDHVIPVNGNDREPRYDLAKEILRRDFPDDYQILCYNCNMAKRTNPACPHEDPEAPEFRLGLHPEPPPRLIGIKSYKFKRRCQKCKELLPDDFFENKSARRCKGCVT